MQTVEQQTANQHAPAQVRIVTLTEAVDYARAELKKGRKPEEIAQELPRFGYTTPKERELSSWLKIQYEAGEIWERVEELVASVGFESRRSGKALTGAGLISIMRKYHVVPKRTKVMSPEGQARMLAPKPRKVYTPPVASVTSIAKPVAQESAQAHADEREVLKVLQAVRASRLPGQMKTALVDVLLAGGA